VRLFASTLTLGEVRPKIKELMNQLFRDVPSGAGRSSLWLG
jgi:RNA-splicing ligase RtcB